MVVALESGEDLALVALARDEPIVAVLVFDDQFDLCCSYSVRGRDISFNVQISVVETAKQHAAPADQTLQSSLHIQQFHLSLDVLPIRREVVVDVMNGGLEVGSFHLIDPHVVHLLSEVVLQFQLPQVLQLLDVLADQIILEHKQVYS